MYNVIRYSSVCILLRKHAGVQKNTVKFLNFRTPVNFVVIYLKFKQGSQILEYFFGITNSVNPDQIAPLGFRSALSAQTDLSENL